MATDRILQHPQPLDPFDDIPVAYAVFQLIFDAAHSQVVNARYVYVNRAYCRMAGCAREDLVGRNFLDLYPEGVLWFPYCQEGEKRDGPCLPLLERDGALAGLYRGARRRRGSGRLHLHNHG